jgi:multicomponent K+:H+ antiporter subunit E
MTARRLLPSPWQTAFLAAIWLIANQSIGAGTILMALVLGIAIPHFSTRFWPDAPERVNALPFLKLMAVVLADIVRANVRVARLVLGPTEKLRPGFIVVPLDLKHPWAITALTSIITLTPGTVSTNVSDDRSALLVHMLDVSDRDAAVGQIKARYERPLMEVFPC